MQRAISTHVFLQQRLHTGHLDALVAGGAQSIELFAARHHIDYTDRGSLKDIAAWFRSNNVSATLHQPIYADGPWSRHVQATINLIDVEKSRRIDAMDEVKRALETAEQINIDNIVLHLGSKDDKWSERTIDNSLTAIEHIKAFAHPLGAKVLLKTLSNDVATPEHLLEILRIGHFDTVNLCIDTGHMNLPGRAGVENAFALLGNRVKEVHLHDNNGQSDEHLFPGEGNIDWAVVRAAIAAMKEPPRGVLEIAHEPEIGISELPPRATKAFKLLEQ